jgi:hypothetical protein
MIELHTHTKLTGTRLLVLAACFLGVALAGQTRSPLSSYDSTFNDALRRFDNANFDEFRMDISPLEPDSGISSGYVVVYGHCLKPPFSVLAKDTTVFINNVQVYPQLVSPRVIAAPKVHEESRVRVPDSVALYYHNKDSVERAAYPLYANAAAKYGRSEALKRTRDFVMGSGVAESIRMEPPSMLLVYNKLTHRSVAITFYTHEELKALTVEAPSPNDSGKHTLAVQVAAGYSRSLGRGHYLAFGDGSAGGPGGDFERIREVMQNHKLSLREKFARIVADGFPMAGWIVANYSEREWSGIR